MEEGPIPLSEIRDYLDLYEVDERDKFIRLMLAMDRAYLEYRAKQKAQQPEVIRR